MDVNEIISSGLLELYVLGMANEQETVQVIAMSKQYPEVAAEVLAIELSLEHYARVHAVNPAMRLKEKVFDGINGIAHNVSPANPVSTAPAKVVAVSSFWKYAAAASIILFIGTAVLTVNYYDKFKKANTELEAIHKEKSDMEQQLTAEQESNEKMKDNWKIIQSKYSEPHTLNSLPTAPDTTAIAKIFWIKNTGDVYIDVSNLPDAPDGMQYQFWGIVDGKPVDGGVINIKSKEDKFIIKKMKSFGRAEAFAVTLETMGGNPQPKGRMFVMGKMQ